MYDIKELIPQRDPIMMVDSLDKVEGDTCVTTLVVRADNYFLDSDGMMLEPGVVENIAQSASAFAGYRDKVSGAVNPPVGLIGEVKRFHLYRRPKKGEKLTTTITLGPTAGKVSIVFGETHVGDEKIADTQMKIALREA